MADHKLLGVCLLTMLALSLCFAIQGSVAQTVITESKLQTANSAVEQAFNAVSIAEEQAPTLQDCLNN
jgi:hypothetical protein